MAGDWIKMRTDLFTHPKVVRMSSALKADTLRTVGGLMSVWCLFDAHSDDGRLIGYTVEILDDHLRWPGFSSAMQAIDWLGDDGQSLVLPEFSTHNGQSAKRRAQDADRKREVRKTSASDADKMRTREEKRREEKKEAKAKEKPARAAHVFLPAPDWLDPVAWAAWCDYRKGKKWGEDQQQYSLDKLAILRRDGNDPVAVIRQSIGNTWTGLFPVKSSGATNHGTVKPSLVERVNANGRAAESAEREAREQHRPANAVGADDGNLRAPLDGDFRRVG